MNTCESSYKKSSVACGIRNKTSGDPCTEVTAAMPRVFALWELESDPNYPSYFAGQPMMAASLKVGEVLIVFEKIKI